jgi:hypothetical protein
MEPLYDNAWQLAKGYNLICPICKVFLGYRNDHLKVDKGHCAECKATFLFSKENPVPFKSMLDVSKKRGCACASCKERDSVE